MPPVPTPHPVIFFDGNLEQQRAVAGFTEQATTNANAMVQAIEGAMGAVAEDAETIRTLATQEGVRPAVAQCLGVLADVLDTRVDTIMRFDPPTEDAIARSRNQRARERAVAESGGNPSAVLALRLGRLGVYGQRMLKYERERPRAA